MRSIPIISFLVIALLGPPGQSISQDSALIYTQQALELFKRNERDSAELFAARAIRSDSIDPVVKGL